MLLFMLIEIPLGWNDIDCILQGQDSEVALNASRHKLNAPRF